MTNASTERVTQQIGIAYTNGAAIDITLRIGLPQLEQGAFATSVIPTTTTALTRNADAASMTGTNFSSWYNASEGTLYAAWQMSSSAAGVFAINDNSANNRIQITNQGSTAIVQAIIVNGGISQADANAGSFLLNGTAKSALAYKQNDIAFSANGGAVVTDTSATIPTVNQSQFGFRAGGAVHLNNTIRSIRYYPVRNANSQLQALTG